VSSVPLLRFKINPAASVIGSGDPCFYYGKSIGYIVGVAQFAMARIMSISLPCGAKQQRILQTAIARAESQNDQSRAALEALKALLNEE
jgi:hypothetical protein